MSKDTKDNRFRLPFAPMGKASPLPTRDRIADTLRLAEGREIAHLTALQTVAKQQTELLSTVQMQVAQALDALLENKPDAAQQVLQGTYHGLEITLEQLSKTIAGMDEQKRGAQAGIDQANVATGAGGTKH